MAKQKKKKSAKQKKNEKIVVGVVLLAGGVILAKQQGWFTGTGVPLLDPTAQAGFGFGAGATGDGNGGAPAYLTPYEKYYYDIRNEQPGDALEIYRRNYSNNVNDLQTSFPDVADFWNYLWGERNFMAYKSYNQKQQWLPGEKVISIQ